ncbi:MAG: GNAT family N-acetyltransferase [Oscillospiraceae bacterium]|nr:GNAT family N-acetyltransferase [Oscillospiraceae bacterium]
MKIKTYSFLPDEAVTIRTAVFMEEQGFQNEFDETDNHAFHLVAYSENDEPVAVCRIYESEKGAFVFGRLAVVKEFRGKKVGSRLITQAERVVSDNGGKSLILHAQCRAKGFYSKLGYCTVGEQDEDEGCPHIWMKKTLI